jgi:hypothetical protein
MKNNIDEHDLTKKMLDTIRNGFRLSEDTQIKEETKDTISPINGDSVFNSEYDKLSTIVDPSAFITNFKIYPVDKNVIILGNLINGSVKFRMELKKDSVELNTGMIELNDANNEIFKKFKGYFLNWKDEWSKKITTEYKVKNEYE